MITNFTHTISLKKGIKLDAVNFHSNEFINCLDAHLLHLRAGGHLVSCLVYVGEYDEVLAGKPCEALELRLESTLKRLEGMLQTQRS